MCGKDTPGIFVLEERIGTHMPNRLSVKTVVHGHQTGLFFLCPETVDFMIGHLTKMRKQFVAECGDKND